MKKIVLRSFDNNRRKKKPKKSKNLKTLIAEYDQKLKSLEHSRSNLKPKRHRRCQSFQDPGPHEFSIKKLSLLKRPTEPIRFSENLYTEDSQDTCSFFQTEVIKDTLVSVTPPPILEEDVEYNPKENSEEFQNLSQKLEENEIFYLSKIRKLKEKIEILREEKTNLNLESSLGITLTSYSSEKEGLKEEFQSELENALLEQKKMLEKEFKLKMDDMIKQTEEEHELKLENVQLNLLKEFNSQKENMKKELEESHKISMNNRESEIELKANALIKAHTNENERKVKELTNVLNCYKKRIEELEDAPIPSVSEVSRKLAVCHKCQALLSVEEELSKRLKKLSSLMDK